MDIRPYIGVTGFMTRNEVDAVLSVVPRESDRLIMIGVLVSSKTMYGGTNKWPNRYPTPEKIAEIFPDDTRALNLVHFNTDAADDELLNQLSEVTDLAGPNFHGFQLNLRWPRAGVIVRYKMKYPGKVIVLQCGAAALAEVDHDPKRLASEAIGYYGICEYLLIDPSGGYGKPFDPEEANGYLRVLDATLGTDVMGYGVAGGLNPDTLETLMTPVLKAYPDVSMDAEGKLRDGDDRLDVTVAKAFVAEAYVLSARF